MFKLKTPIPEITDESTKFTIDGGFYVSDDETVFIKVSEETKKLFIDED